MTWCVPRLRLTPCDDQTRRNDVRRDHHVDRAPGSRTRAGFRTGRAIDPTGGASARFVAGYSALAPNGCTAYEFTVFDSEPAACAFMRLVGQDRPGQVEYGVQRSEVTLVEVTAVARAE